MGFVTANDNLNISFSENETLLKISELENLSEHIWRLKYNRKKDARDWTYHTAKKDAIENKSNDNIQKVSYRPFDTRYTLYTGNSRGVYSSPQPKITQHILNRDNINFISVRLGRNADFHNYFLTKSITDKSVISSLDNANIFPLYIYSDSLENQKLLIDERVPNLNKEIIQQIADKIGLNFTNEKKETANTFAPIDVLDYIYAVLHSPTYREKYKEFLKIDFPRIPYPKDAAKFWQLVKLGRQIRQMHLLESSTVDNYITSYPQDGNNVVDAIRYDAGRVYINPTQYFDNVPASTWQFYIGGYQPAQKWLKDRKGRELSFDDILHYQRMIVALSETERLMGEIDKLEVE